MGNQKGTYIICRNLAPEVIAKIDFLAKKNQVSREEYIRRYLTNLAVLDEMKNMEMRYSELIESLLELIEQNVNTLEKVEKKLDAISGM